MQRNRGTWNSVWRADAADCCLQHCFEHEGASCGSDVILLQEFVMTSCCALTTAMPVSAEKVVDVRAAMGNDF